MLTAGFLVLLTVAVVGINKMMVDKDTGFYEKEALEQAATLAGSLLEEISRKKFDEQVDTTSAGLQDPTEFTLSGSLGPDAIWSSFFGIPYISGYEQNNVTLPDSITSTMSIYRSVSNANTRYDDIDDYNGYIRAASSGTLTGFRLWSTVSYVDTTLTVTTTRTHLKKVTVYVMNWHYLSDTLVFSNVFSFQ